MREIQVQRPVVNHAKKLGWWAIKINPLGFRGFPDYMFLGYGGRIIFIEFKAPKQHPTKLQLFNIGMLVNRGFEVHVIDNIQEGKEVFTNVRN